MKHISLALTLMLFLLCQACTRNDGNIGKQFGQWKLVTISENGTDRADYDGNIYWSFQNTTIEMKQVMPEHITYQTFGNYRIADNTLFISFPDKDFKPLPTLGLPREAELQIVRLTGSDMVLTYGDPAVTFTFKKW